MDTDSSSTAAPSAGQVQNAFQGDLLAQAASLPPAWQDAFVNMREQQTLHDLDGFLDERVQEGAHIFPLRPFRALLGTTTEAMHVVILGHDPYHGPTHAQGLAFSVPDFCPVPPCLRQISPHLATEIPNP